ncbi:MAG TPA: hypothetical protein VHH73_02665, partial [Verrucomicrobiae bacterium]|nr:hypothetical protein [Verrucomicrobiae bacterium]
MKAKFEVFRHFYVLVLLSILLWSVWTMAQERPAATPADAAQAAGAPAGKSGSHLTFGLDHIQYLALHNFQGVPYWQWIAVVIYFAISVTIAKLADYLIHTRLRK